MAVRERRALVVVGGGLAGLAASIEARRAGLETLLIEQRAAVRGPRPLVVDARDTGADIRENTACWGIWGHEVAVCEANRPSQVVVADQVILATGAYERPVAFPGWTLPGVMTAGGAVRLLEQAVAPGQRVLVAGYGEWAASTAAELRAGGVNVIDVVDASAREPRIVVRAEGDTALRAVRVAGVDDEWCPTPGTESEVDVDVLVLAYGKLPENQLARLAGCAYQDSAFLDPRAVCDGWMRSSLPGVFVAGDAAGVVGPAAAVEQGRLAGLAAAVDAGLLTPSEAEARAAPARSRLASAVAMQAPRTGILGLAQPDTVVCRCEDVTAADITARVFEGSLEPGPVIAETRAGMGSCQGRNCLSQVAGVISRHVGQPIQRIPPVTARPPVVPVAVGALAARPPLFEPVTDAGEAD